MSAPDSINLSDLSFPLDGSPFIYVKGTAFNDFDLSWPLDGSPFVSAGEPIITIINVSSIETVQSTDVVVTHSYFPVAFAEPGDVLDSVSMLIYLHITEGIVSTDSVSSHEPPEDRDETAGMRISVASLETEVYGTKVSIGEFQQADYGVNIIVGQTTVAPVTNIYSW